MKWGTKYPASYVRTLRGMVSRHLAQPHRFVCVTDDDAGLADDMECLDLPAVPIETNGPERGWLKLGLFSPQVAALADRVLYLDLDVVITGDLSPLVATSEPMTIMQDRRRPAIGNSSVMSYDPSVFRMILEEYVADPKHARASVRHEQTWISHIAQRENKLTFFPRVWCVSFKYDCAYTPPLSAMLTPRLPDDARVVVFHGVPEPSQAVSPSWTKWYRPLRGAPWIRHHWHP